MEQLKQALAQEDSVLFVGSGISLWSELPTWPRMIEELARFVERSGASADLIRSEASRGDLLQAASYGFDKLTKQQIGEFIRISCRYGIAKPHEIHRKIVSLGPRCYITTNYDDLIEQGLRKWQPDRFYPPPVSNRQLTEMAGIVHARAIDFIFKPHGDAADSESIILTREQYRQLLPQGERQAALESVKMLLASRPVLYLGFGLRDPDFIYMRDLLANTYKGGTRDHYAIMADVTAPEIDCWRRNYGIHLFSYTTTKRQDGSRDHSALLKLLDFLLIKSPATVAQAVFDPKSPEVLLALARHAAALGRVQKLASEFSIRVHSETRQRDGTWLRSEKFDHSPVESFLDAGPERAILVGLPGAGKTYSLRRSAARLADSLHEACLGETFDVNAVVVPLFADLKLYRGNLNHLLSEALPSSLPLPELVRCFNVKIFLDSFNEMPREFWETGSYEPDFQKLIVSLGKASLIIGSRTTDGLAKLELPAYSLDQIDKTIVTKELDRLSISFSGRFSEELLWLLQRPFYFQYIATGSIALPAEPHPRDFYKALFANVSNAFNLRFSIQINIEEILSVVAYEALNRGEEAFPLSEMLSSLKVSFDKMGVTTVSPQEFANWLVSDSILIPYTGRRIAFVHQSVTEFLAATELAKRYLTMPGTLKEKLALTRWDQALFLALSLLPSTHADAFLQDIIRVDFALALSAVKYLEVGRDEIVSQLLSEVPERTLSNDPYDWSIQRAIKFSLPLSEVHETHLWKIVQCGDSVGAAAASRLVEIKGEAVKDELLEVLYSARDDYNLCCNGIGVALRPFAVAEDVPKIAAWADEIELDLTPETDEENFHGFVGGAADFLRNVDLSAIRHGFLPSEEMVVIPRVRAKILRDITYGRHTTEALDLAGELLLRGVNGAAFSIHMILDGAAEGSELSCAPLTEAHVDRLITNARVSDDPWEVNALHDLCAVRPDLAEIIKRRATNTSGIEKAALLYCLSPSNLDPVFQALSELIPMREEERSAAPLPILGRIDLDWSGQEQLFVQLLRLRDIRLATALFGGMFPPKILNLGTLDIGSLYWWLDWMLEVTNPDGSEWFLSQMGGLFAEHLHQNDVDQILAEFNKPESKFRRLLMTFVIPALKNVTTDAFSDDTISFLLADLNREKNALAFGGHLLGNTATERFVTERLLPLLHEAQPPFAVNLGAVLRQAGSRHGRRYVIE